MRHGKKFNHLSRTAPHRKAMLSNMASSLILHKRITTTVAKAKALRKYVEPIITKAKDDTTHSRRVVFSYLQNKESVTVLFSEVAEKVANRPGGYTRILKTGNRLGDNADMCIMELVDFNELMLKEAAPEKKTRRSRRGKGTSAETTPVVETTETSTEETEAIEEPIAEATIEEAEVIEEPTTEEKEAETVAEETIVEDAAAVPETSDDVVAEAGDEVGKSNEEDAKEEKPSDKAQENSEKEDKN